MYVKINTWGYSTINFFAPMTRYASSGGGPLKASQEFKEMVKALHDAGIEVIVSFAFISNSFMSKSSLSLFTIVSLKCSFLQRNVSIFSFYRSFWMLSTTIPMRLMMSFLTQRHFVA